MRFLYNNIVVVLRKNTFITFIFYSLLLATVTSCSKDTPSPQEEDEMEDEMDDETPIEAEFIRTYGGSGVDEGVAVVPTTDGNYVIAGTTQSNDGDLLNIKTTADADIWIFKVTTSGEIQWSKTYGGTANDIATNISNTNDNGFIVSGYTRSTDGDVTDPGNAGFHDFWILKLDSTGNIQWNKTFGYSGSDQCYKAFPTSTGGYFISGFLDVSASEGEGNEGRSQTGQKGANLHGVGEFWGMLLDGNGNAIWKRYFGGTNNDRSYDALETADGGFLMAGASESDDFDITDSKGSYDFWAVRLSSSGDLMWTKSFGGDGIEIGYAVTKTNDGNYMMVGDTRSTDQDISTPLGNADAWIVKFSDEGNLIWEKTYGGTEFDSAKSIFPLSNGNYLISGSTRSGNGDLLTNNGQNDAWYGIIAPNGTLESVYSAGGSNLEFIEDAIALDNNSILMVGNTESSDLDIPSNQGSKDVLLIKI